MDHAPNEATVLPHGTIHGQPKPVHPEAQTLLQISAGYNRNARLNGHLHLRVAELVIGLRDPNGGSRHYATYPGRLFPAIPS
jgi:hypothetical protein